MIVTTYQTVQLLPILREISRFEKNFPDLVWSGNKISRYFILFLLKYSSYFSYNNISHNPNFDPYLPILREYFCKVSRFVFRQGWTAWSIISWIMLSISIRGWATRLWCKTGYASQMGGFPSLNCPGYWSPFWFIDMGHVFVR